MKKVISIFLVASTTLSYSINTYPLPDFVKEKKIAQELTTQQYVEIIKPFLPDNPIILEAGAHDGRDTIVFAKSWPRGRVFAFEPVPRFHDRIVDSIKKQGLLNITLLPYALFSRPDNYIFYVSTRVEAASSLLQNNNVCDFQDYPITVKGVNLDEWAQTQGIAAIDFMWLDMEGAEKYVLESAPMMVKTARVIFTELNFLEFRKGMTQSNELYDLLLKNGFTLCALWGNPIWPHQANGLFVRSELLKKP